MLTVPEAAKLAGKNPETIRRWIRSGKLRASKFGTQHMIDEIALDEIIHGVRARTDIPDWLKEPGILGITNDELVRLVREDRDRH